MIPTILTKIRWLRMIEVKNCIKNHNCKCADNYRKILLKIPINDKEESLIELEIEAKEKIYKKCFMQNKLL